MVVRNLRVGACASAVVVSLSLGVVAAPAQAQLVEAEARHPIAVEQLPAPMALLPMAREAVAQAVDVRARGGNAEKEIEAAEIALQRVELSFPLYERSIESRVAARDQLVRQRASIGSVAFTEDELRLLASQATAEMINAYRVANGLHPLATHGKYVELSAHWNAVMIRDYAALGFPKTNDAGFRSAFRHSKAEDYGRAGENIMFGGGDATPSTQWWAAEAEGFFTGWRNSPGHNKNMLSPIYDTGGLDIAIAPDKSRWGTHMFFNDRVDLVDNRFYNRTPAMNGVSNPFIPAGAMEALGITNWKAPTDTNGVPTDYSRIRGGKAEMDRRVASLPTGFLPGIDATKLAKQKQAAELSAKIAELDAEIADMRRGLDDAKRKLAELRRQLHPESGSSGSSVSTPVAVVIGVLAVLLAGGAIGAFLLPRAR